MFIYKNQGARPVESQLTCTHNIYLVISELHLLSQSTINFSQQFLLRLFSLRSVVRFEAI